MELLNAIIETSAILAILLPILTLCLIWLFIRSAVASGVKRGILDAKNELSNTTEKLEKEIREELDGWK